MRTIKPLGFFFILILGAFSLGARAQAQTTALSHNWSGYIANGSNFTGISGTWVVPSVAPSDSVETDTTWVGIGGVNNHNIIQAGTDAVVLNGEVFYHAWFERLPNDPNIVRVPLQVSSGDSVTVSITESSKNQWSFDFKNNTTGDTYSITLPFVSNEASAEWIEEMPLVESNVQATFDNFGKVDFSNAYAVSGGSPESPLSLGAEAVTMYEGGQILASPSGLGQNGASFSIARLNASREPAQATYILPGKAFTA